MTSAGSSSETVGADIVDGDEMREGVRLTWGDEDDLGDAGDAGGVRVRQGFPPRASLGRTSGWGVSSSVPWPCSQPSLVWAPTTPSFRQLQELSISLLPSPPPLNPLYIYPTPTPSSSLTKPRSFFSFYTMFNSARRVCSVLPRSARAFTTTAPQLSKLPTLGDYTHTPASNEAFNKAVEEFRAAHAPPAHIPTGPKPGVVKSILYGSTQGQEEEKQMEQSYSQVLARGKYVHSIEFHEVKPECHAEYVDLIGETYSKIASNLDNKCHLVGSWKAEIGSADTFVHIWEYNGCEFFPWRLF